MTQKSINYTTLILEEPVEANGIRYNHSLFEWCIENEIEAGPNKNESDQILYDLKKSTMTQMDRDKTVFWLNEKMTFISRLTNMADFAFVVDNAIINDNDNTIENGDIRVTKCRTTTVREAQEFIDKELETDTFSNVVKKLYRCELSFQK